MGCSSAGVIRRGCAEVIWCGFAEKLGVVTNFSVIFVTSVQRLSFMNVYVVPERKIL